MTRFDRLWPACILGGLLVFLASGRPAFAYSALTHEAIVDAAWDDSIKPLLLKKYAGASDQELREAHAYAYGGCIVQDMGYYPFGNKFFTDLLHYVRSGDFAAALLAEAEPINEYAFALGALEHYLADQTGHSEATNVVVSMEFPELRDRYDSWVTYEDDPTAHLQIEFGFDVLQVALGHYTPEADHDFIGFQVAKDLLNRTFYKVYGLKVSDLFVSEDLAIGTYRHTVSEIIPEATKIAWEMKKDELQQALPGLRREQFVYDLSREDYERQWGNQYERPHWYDKVLAFFFRLTPEVGPVRALHVKPLTPEAERLFVASFKASLARYRHVLEQLPRGVPALANINLDTGEPIRAGSYRWADDTHAALLERLRDHCFADVTPQLRDRLLAYYGDLSGPITTKRDEDAWWKLVTALVKLRSSAPEQLVASSARPRPTHLRVATRRTAARPH